MENKSKWQAPVLETLDVSMTMNGNGGVVDHKKCDGSNLPGGKDPIAGCVAPS